MLQSLPSFGLYESTHFLLRAGSLISDSWYAVLRYCGVYQ
jgi:hypothetical protein